MAFGCLALTAGTSVGLAWQSLQSRVTPYVVEVDRFGEARAVQAGRQGRRPTPANAPPSRWQQIMLEAKKAFDTYLPLYVKSRPTRLTARTMARMSQGYSALSSDPQFSTIFRI